MPIRPNQKTKRNLVMAYFEVGYDIGTRSQKTHPNWYSFCSRQSPYGSGMRSPCRVYISLHKYLHKRTTILYFTSLYPVLMSSQLPTFQLHEDANIFVCLFDLCTSLSGLAHYVSIIELYYLYVYMINERSFSWENNVIRHS